MIDEATISQRLKELRSKLHLKQDEFIDGLQISRVSYSGYEQAKTSIPLRVLVSIAQKYSTSLDWLCGLKNNPQIRDLLNYRDLFEMLIKIQTSLPNTYIGEDQQPHANSTLTSSVNEDAVDGCVVTYNLVDGVMSRAIKEYQEMIALRNSNTITDDIFRLWLAGKLQELEKIPLPKTAGSNDEQNTSDEGGD